MQAAVTAGLQPARLTCTCAGSVRLLMADGSRRDVRIERAHMEEDAGKSGHAGAGSSTVDYNRAGEPAATRWRRSASLQAAQRSRCCRNASCCVCNVLGYCLRALMQGVCRLKVPELCCVLTGVPLLEVVTGPDLRSGKEAATYAAELRRVMVLLGVLDSDMQVSQP